MGSEEQVEMVVMGEQQPCAPKESRPQIVLKQLLAAHETWFDVRRGYELAGRVFGGFAEFHSYGERYVLVKRAKLWEVATHEYLFFDVVETLDAQTLGELVSLMKTEAIKLVEPKPNHMSSNISLVVIAQSVAQGMERGVRRVRYRKNFKMGLWGWSDLRVAVIDLAGGPYGRILTNAAGKALKTTLEANLRTAATEEGEGR